MKTVQIYLIFSLILFQIYSSFEQETSIKTRNKRAGATVLQTTPQTTTKVATTKITTKAPTTQTTTKVATVKATTKAATTKITTKAPTTQTTTKPTQINQVTNSSLCYCTSGFKLDSSNNLICSGDCNGKQRSANEVDCRFPFFYNGTWYDKCTNAGKTFLWCSIDLYYNNRIAKCEQECPKLARNVNIGSNLPKGQSGHVLCWNTTSGWAELPLTNNDINLIVSEHNNIRGNVSVPAAKMRSVSWDWGLARQCQRLAENGDFNHYVHPLVNNKSSGVGQNLYALYGSSYKSGFWTG